MKSMGVLVAASACLTCACATTVPSETMPDTQPLFVTSDLAPPRETTVKKHFLTLCAVHRVREFTVSGLINARGKSVSVRTNLPQRVFPDTDLQRKMNRYTWPQRTLHGRPAAWRFEQNVVCPALIPQA